MTRQEIKQLVATLTLEEKVSLLSGKDVWQTRDIPEKGIDSIFMADGPHGLRKEDKAHAKENGGHSVKATCFPTAVTLAASWDEQLLNDVGKAIAEECKANGVSVILGPGANIKRSPMCGRNFEYLSEDPLLAGKLAAAIIRGAENEGVGTSLKHFAANNQETLRMSISSEIDERALNEIYLKPFEIAVKEGKPSTVMCSYNKINGTYASENKMLLTYKLRDEWGFDGTVISDWGAVANRPLGIEAGLDLEMPSSGGYCNADIMRTAQSGALAQKYIDAACENIIALTEKLKPTEAPQPCDMQAHHALAVQALCKSAVLLKNEGEILPLKKGERVAFIGEMGSAAGRFQGCGSSIVNAANRVDPLTAYKSKTVESLVYAKGYNLNSDEVDKALEAAALHIAGEADKVVFFAGLSDIYETECYDRETMQLPENQQHLLEAVMAENPNVVVVITAGSPVAMPWVSGARAVLYTALGGEGVGEATFDLLYGTANPCGRLAETWPRSFEETPCAKHWPMGPRLVTYNESIYVGYRYYDKAEKPVLYPFGHGLSYTSFEYTNMRAAGALAKGDALEVIVTVTNTGSADGTEVIQLYMQHGDSAAYQPVRELKAFTKVSLKAGEGTDVTLTVPYSALAFYDVSVHGFVTEVGTYIIDVGASSRDIRLSGQVHVDGEAVSLAKEYSHLGAYGTVKDNEFSDDAFYSIYSRGSYGRPRNVIPPRGAFDMSTTLGQMADASPFARKIVWLAKKLATPHMHFSTNPAVNKRAVEKSVEYLPFKNVGLQSGGAITALMTQTMLDMCNGQAKAIDLWRAWHARKPHKHYIRKIKAGIIKFGHFLKRLWGGLKIAAAAFWRFLKCVWEIIKFCAKKVADGVRYVVGKLNDKMQKTHSDTK